MDLPREALGMVLACFPAAAAGQEVAIARRRFRRHLRLGPGEQPAPGAAEAVAEAGGGRVLLVDGQGALHRSLLGDRLAQLAAHNGWSGGVVIGAVRDVEVIDGIDIGVQALGVCPVKTDKQGVGDRDVTLLLGSVTVQPGDWLYADRNGVLVSSEQVIS